MTSRRRDHSRIDTHYGIPGHRTRAKAWGEDSRGVTNDAFGDGIGDGDRDTRSGSVTDLIDVEIELVRRKTGRSHELRHHCTVRLVRYDQIDRIEERARGILHVAGHGQLLHHLYEISSH